MKEQFEKLGKISRHKKGIGMADKKVLLVKIWVRFIIVSMVMYAQKTWLFVAWFESLSCGCSTNNRPKIFVKHLSENTL